jgi:hypothetical protein
MKFLLVLTLIFPMSQVKWMKKRGQMIINQLSSLDKSASKSGLDENGTYFARLRMLCHPSVLVS